MLNAKQKAIRDGRYEKFGNDSYILNTKYGDLLVTKWDFDRLCKETARENWASVNGYNSNIEHTAFMADIMDAYNDSKLQYAM